MTRNGSLAYYLAAWVCGCFFLTLGVWAAEIWRRGAPGLVSPVWMHGASGLLFAYFYGLILGLVPVLAAAFVLRQAMRAAKWKGVWEWMAAGGAVFCAVIYALAWAGREWGGVGAERAVEGALPFLIFHGASVLIAVGWWLALPAGAATGLVLQRVDRAFGRDAATEPSQQRS
jgi:hypothetical protein